MTMSDGVPKKSIRAKKQSIPRMKNRTSMQKLEHHLSSGNMLTFLIETPSIVILEVVHFENRFSFKYLLEPLIITKTCRQESARKTDIVNKSCRCSAGVLVYRKMLS